MPRLEYEGAGTKVEHHKPTECSWEEILQMGLTYERSQTEHYTKIAEPRLGIGQAVRITLGPLAETAGIIEAVEQGMRRNRGGVRYVVLIGGTIRANVPEDSLIPTE